MIASGPQISLLADRHGRARRLATGRGWVRSQHL